MAAAAAAVVVVVVVVVVVYLARLYRRHRHNAVRLVAATRHGDLTLNDLGGKRCTVAVRKKKDLGGGRTRPVLGINLNHLIPHP